MSFLRVFLSLSLAAALSLPALANTSAHRSATYHASARSAHSGSARSRKHKVHGQQAIDPDRVSQIQQALAREHYLSGDANGQWDSTTQAAMQKYQSDHGWQTRLLPDSRALKALGLGPDYSGAINAKDVAASGPPAAAGAATIPPTQAAGFATASGVNR